jgi:hypothetical protein
MKRLVWASAFLKRDECWDALKIVPLQRLLDYPFTGGAGDEK